MMDTHGLAVLQEWTKKAYIQNNPSLMLALLRAFHRMTTTGVITQTTPETRALLKTLMKADGSEIPALAKSLYEL